MIEPNDHIVPTSTAGAPTEPTPPVLDRTPQHSGTNGQNGEQDRGTVHGQNGEQVRGPAQGQNGEQDSGTTAAQLRRFIKSRPYVPLHELRRRFELNGDYDDVTCIETPDGRAYIGLPAREGRFMSDLVRQGEVGLELGHDPEVPIVVGVFPMRPVGR